MSRTLIDKYTQILVQDWEYAFQHKAIKKERPELYEEARSNAVEIRRALGLGVPDVFLD